MQTHPLKLIFVVLSLSKSSAFHVSTTLKKSPAVVSQYGHPNSLQGMMRPEDFAEDNSFDLEDARQKLESLVGGGGEGKQQQLSPTLPKPTFGSGSSDFFATTDIFKTLKTVRLPKAPPLTSIDRERRQAEIELLGRLSDGDEALSDLWILWFQERGAKAAARLTRAEELSSQSYTWGQAEVMLRELIDEYGVHWVEPVNRLATLYYRQGKLFEAEALCKTVLAVKPWHFGALSGIVMIYAGMQKVDQARHWAAHRLPTFAPVGPNRRRKQWVRKAEGDAQVSLLRAERRLQEAFGMADDHVSAPKTVSNYDEFDDDAWQ